MLAAVSAANARGDGRNDGDVCSYPPYYFGNDHDFYLPSYYYDDNPPACHLDHSVQDFPPYYGCDYLVLGHDLGKGLRQKTVSQDCLVGYLRKHITNVPLNMRDDFRRGFVSGYGEGATSVLKRAVQEARHPELQTDTTLPSTAEPILCQPNTPSSS
jgi:hypothetical protein